jgi:uncharacterized protein YukE
MSDHFNSINDYQSNLDNLSSTRSPLRNSRARAGKAAYEKSATQQKPSTTVKMSSMAKEYATVLSMLNEETDEVREEAVNRGKALLKKWDGLRDDQVDLIASKLMD